MCVPTEIFADGDLRPAAGPPSSLLPRSLSSRFLVALALAGWVLALLAMPLAAQEGESESATSEVAGADSEVASDPEAALDPEAAAEARQRLERLVDRLEERYDLSEDDGEWELWPEDNRDDFERITVKAGRIRVDDRPVDTEDLTRFVDDDALEIAELAELVDLIERAGGADRIEEGTRERPRERSERRRRSDTQVSFGSSLVIAEDESVRDVVLIGGPLEVHGEVDGDATVVMGSAVVSGRIDGSLTVAGGSISLLDGASVEGDVVAVGGSVDQEGTVDIDGEIVQVDVAEAIDIGDVRVDMGDMDFDWPHFEFFGFSFWDLISRALKTCLVAICLIFLAFLAPNKTQAISQRARLEPWKAILVGLVTLVLFPALLALVVALLALSIVGIPLLLAVVPLMFVILLLLYLLGFGGVAHAWGRFLVDRFGGGPIGVVMLVLIGLFAIDIWSFVGEVASVLPWPFKIFAVMFLASGFCLKFVAWTMGLGAAVLEQFAPLPAAGPPPVATSELSIATRATLGLDADPDPSTTSEER